MLLWFGVYCLSKVMEEVKHDFRMYMLQFGQTKWNFDITFRIDSFSGYWYYERVRDRTEKASVYKTV